MIVCLPLVAHAEATDEAIAKDMATLFRSARAVIAKHQAEINNPDLEELRPRRRHDRGQGKLPGGHGPRSRD